MNSLPHWTSIAARGADAHACYEGLGWFRQWSGRQFPPVLFTSPYTPLRSHRAAFTGYRTRRSAALSLPPRAAIRARLSNAMVPIHPGCQFECSWRARGPAPKTKANISASRLLRIRAGYLVLGISAPFGRTSKPLTRTFVDNSSLRFKCKTRQPRSHEFCFPSPGQSTPRINAENKISPGSVRRTRDTWSGDGP